jgi:hypothetical protein
MELDTILFIKDVIIYGLIAILLITAIIIYFVDKKKKHKQDIQELEEIEFENFCKDIPEIQILLENRDKYLDKVLTLYADLTSIQTVYNFITEHIKSAPEYYDPLELKNIQEFLDKRYKELYIEFKKYGHMLNNQQVLLTACYNDLYEVFKQEKLKDGSRIAETTPY